MTLSAPALSDAQRQIADELGAQPEDIVPAARGAVDIYRVTPHATWRWRVGRAGEMLDAERFGTRVA